VTVTAGGTTCAGVRTLARGTRGGAPPGGGEAWAAAPAPAPPTAADGWRAVPIVAAACSPAAASPQAPFHALEHLGHRELRLREVVPYAQGGGRGDQLTLGRSREHDHGRAGAPALRLQGLEEGQPRPSRAWPGPARSGPAVSPGRRQVLHGRLRRTPSRTRARHRPPRRTTPRSR
jgi:hypothetical protein